MGDFDGRQFSADDPPGTVRWLDFGADNYAGITYNNVPEKDGRRIFIGWMNNWRYAEKTPTAPWRGAMTTPRELTLTQEDGRVFLLAQPVSELTGTRTGGFRLGNERIDSEKIVREKELSGGVFEITAEWEVRSTAGFGIALTNECGQEVVVGLDPAAGRLWIDRSRSGHTDFSKHFPGVHYAPISLKGGRLTAQILVDTCSVEVFASGGRAVMTDLVFPSAPYDQLRLFSRGGPVTVLSLSGWGLGRYRRHNEGEI
ncbi:MAG: GH32 C-terminal domain-containing protein [Deltaproteobacteria bacterium]|nr:GH32 C-terminal domain-containing protein [Candidatus Zymogenaceae bacterium]